MIYTLQSIKISDLIENTGQIEGVPRNPRFIKDYKYRKLLDSLAENPEMTALKELWVVQLDGKYVVISGNMRLKAMKELRFKNVPCKVLDPGIKPEDIRAYAIKDNISYGDDDLEILEKEWDNKEVEKWWVDMPSFTSSANDETDHDESDWIQFAFSRCFKERTTGGSKYFSLFNNNSMELEKMKQNKDNINPFVFPLYKYIVETGMNNIIIPPPGERTEKNGFHFITEIVHEISKIMPINIFCPFVNVRNHISYKNIDLDASQSYLWCDDIITRGNTLNKCKKLLYNNGITNVKFAIIICNH